MIVWKKIKVKGLKEKNFDSIVYLCLFFFDK